MIPSLAWLPFAVFEVRTYTTPCRAVEEKKSLTDEFKGELANSPTFSNTISK